MVVVSSNASSSGPRPGLRVRRWEAGSAVVYIEPERVTHLVSPLAADWLEASDDLRQQLQAEFPDLLPALRDAGLAV